MQNIFGLILPFLMTVSLWSTDSQTDYRDSSLYCRFIEKVTYQNVGHNTMVSIDCSDKTTWKFMVSPEKEVSLDELQLALQEGIEINPYVDLYSNPGAPDFWLFVTGVKFKVGLSKESLLDFPKITEIYKEIITEGGFFSREESKHFVFLSDGSVWEIESNMYQDETLKNWCIEDRIFIIRTGNGSIIIFNIDAPWVPGDSIWREMYPKLLNPPSYLSGE